MPVNTKHAKFQEMEKRWQKVDDVCEGEHIIKKKANLYLPQPNVSDDQAENDAYYESFLKRAVFYEITKDTLNENVGLAFAEDPTFNPDGLDFLKYDADGTGKSIYQVAQSALHNLLKKGRGGLFVDYPTTENGQVSQYDVENNGVKPTIIHFNATQIINWRVRKVGTVYKTVLVVLHQKEEKLTGDEFSQEDYNLYRVLRLDESGSYCQQTYSDESGSLVPGKLQYPTQNGTSWKFIPFMPLGSFANDWNIDPIPLESLASMNLAHYQNSASYEDMTFICGQAQPTISNLDKSWAEWLQENGMRLGSRSPLMLPVNSTFEFKQVTENSLPKEAMQTKEQYMAAQGAKLTNEATVVKTATQSDNEAMAKYSVLSLCVANINEAFEQVLKWCAMYAGQGNNAKFVIAQDFAKGKLTLDDLKFYNELALQGKISHETLWEILQSGKVPELNYEEEQLRIESQQANQSLPSYNDE